MKLDVALDKQLLDMGIKHYHSVDFAKHPHCQIVGNSGSGKSYATRLLLGRAELLYGSSGLQTTVIDFKGQDYAYARGSKRLYEYNAAKRGLELFHQEFLSRLEGKSTDPTYRLLVIEELSSMLAYYPKKEVDSIKAAVAQLILMGRSMRFIVCISNQRNDASLFNSGVRDSIGNTIALGNLSKESKSMLFKGYENQMDNLYSIGSGYMLIDGAGFHKIQIPLVTKSDKLNQCIIDSLNR